MLQVINIYYIDICYIYNIYIINKTLDISYIYICISYIYTTVIV